MFRNFVSFLIVVLVCVSPQTLWGQSSTDSPGAFDTTFGAGGRVSVGFLNSAATSATDIAAQADGKIVYTGYLNSGDLNRFGVSRVLANGRPDSSFGQGGTVIVDFPEHLYSAAEAVVVQPDGRILVGGKAFGAPQPSYQVALARLLQDGSLDPTFDGDGRALIDFVDANEDGITALALQPDGKIIAAGTTDDPMTAADLAVARLNPDGSVDGSFGSGGLTVFAITYANESITDAVVAADGSICVSIRNLDRQFIAARLSPAGLLDPAFDGDGIATIALPSYGGSTSDLAVRPDGRIVLVGSDDFTGDSTYDMLALQLDQAGHIDPLFGVGGFARISALEYDDAVSCSIRPNGSIVVIGFGSQSEKPYSEIALLKADGTLDAGFGAGGVAITPLSYTSAIRCGCIDSSGRIVSAGDLQGNGRTDSLIVRSLATGTADPTFGTGGIARIDVKGPGNDEVRQLAVDGDGRIVCFGATHGGPSSFDQSIVKFRTDGTLDTQFGTDGRVLLVFQGTSSPVGMALQPDGKILICGSSYLSGGGYAITVSRFLRSGVRDVRFGRNGTATIFQQSGCCASAIAIRSAPGGKVVVVGYRYDAAGQSDDAFVARLTSTGLLDRTFGGRGLVFVSNGGDERLEHVAVATNGSIFAAGTFFNYVTGRASITVVKISSTGALDASYGYFGLSEVILPSESYSLGSLALDALGRVVLSGGFHDFGRETNDSYVVRLTTAGVPDSSFGAGGLARYDLDDEDWASGAVPMADGTIVTAGTAYMKPSGARAYFGRLTNSGMLDPSFGVGGIMFVASPPSPAPGFDAVAVQPLDGKIVAAGFIVTERAGTDFFLARVLSQ